MNGELDFEEHKEVLSAIGGCGTRIGKTWKKFDTAQEAFVVINEDYKKELKKSEKYKDAELLDVIGQRIHIGDNIVIASSMSRSGAVLSVGQCCGFKSKTFIYVDYFDNENQNAWHRETISKRCDKVMVIGENTFRDLNEQFCEE